MFTLTVVLENRKEYIPFYSKWAAAQRCKEIGKCADVIGAYVISAETGEILIEYENQKCVWVDGYGEI